MNYCKSISDTQARIGEVRFSYASVFEPKESPNGDKKYSCAVLIPKSNAAAVKLVRDAIEAAKQNGKTSKWGGKIPANCKLPLRDGDEERPDDDNYAGYWFLNASSKNRPAVKVAQDGQLLDALDYEDFYSGCFGAAVLNFYPFDSNGNRGVGVGLNIVIKTRDGEKLSGGVSEATALEGLMD